MKWCSSFCVLFGAQLLVLLVILAVMPGAGWAAQAAGGEVLLPVIAFSRGGNVTTMVSLRSNGTQVNDDSLRPAITDDGRFVMFQSAASNLIDGDSNDAWDIFVHDRDNGRTIRVSLNTNGRQGNDDSRAGDISGDGRFVTFYSQASNLVEEDNNGQEDVFVHDLETGETILISRHSDGTQGNGFSANPAISAGGRFVAFFSSASNLVDDDNNGYDDIFVHDLENGSTTLVSRRTDGSQGNQTSLTSAISGDGRFVAFQSFASNLVDDDTNNAPDIFIHDRQSGQTTLVSRGSDGVQANASSWNPVLSADGRFISFASSATNLAGDDNNGQSDVFLRDRLTGDTTLISRHSDGTVGNQISTAPAVSASGRFVAFSSLATNLVDNDENGFADVFLHDRFTAVTRLVSRSTGGSRGDGDSAEPALSANSHYAAFTSMAANLVPDDINEQADIFVHGRSK